MKKGQVLLRLDDREYRAQTTLAARSLDAARATANQACLAAEQASRDRVRAEGMAGKGLISEQTLEAARTRAESCAPPAWPPASRPSRPRPRWPPRRLSSTRR